MGFPASSDDILRGILRRSTVYLWKPGATPFQREVWRALREIPYGDPITYTELAQQIGRPKTVRAVGLANGANPIGVIVPCHRVIGANGSLTGLRGGGLERKRWLLQHESECLNGAILSRYAKKNHPTWDESEYWFSRSRRCAGVLEWGGGMRNETVFGHGKFVGGDRECLGPNQPSRDGDGQDW